MKEGLVIYDVMQYIKPDVCTYCLGFAASMGALLLSAGAPKKRFSMPHSRIMIHQPIGGFRGQATDVDIQAREILTLRRKLNDILVKHTGQTYKKIETDTDRDYYMSAEEAKKYGLIDQVVEKRT